MEKGITMIRRCASMLSLAAALIVAAAFAQSNASVTANTGAGSGRDAYTQPFTSNSIWNEPIGSGAVYVAAQIAAPTKRALTADQTVTLMDPSAPVTVISRNGGQHSNRCTGSGAIAVAPIPASLVVPSSSSNSGYAVVAADGTTLIEGGAFARCSVSSGPTAGSAKAYGSILSDGLKGGAGGSGLSTLGGLLRVNELVPGGQINHALRVNIDGAADLYPGPGGFRWPATREDRYGPTRYGGHNPALKMGALLALPPNLNLAGLGLSAPALILARALQDYGAYVSNDSARSVFTVATEQGDASAVNQFQSAWGFPFMTSGVSGSPWANDIMLIVKNLDVVNNNGPTSIGGGGTPLVSRTADLTGSGPSLPPSPSATPTGSPTVSPTASPKATPTAAATPRPTSTPTATPTPSPPSGTPHVLVVMEENKGYAATLGSCFADPYLCSLASTYASYTNWHGVGHPSLPNYLAFDSGSTQGCTTDGCATGLTATDLGGQLNAAHIPWTAYMESMPSACYSGGSSGAYARKHNPFVYFTDTASSCAAHDVPYPGSSGLVSALDGSSAPSFVFITPNLVNDMHDGTVQQGDAWLQANLAPVLSSSWFTNFNSTVIVTMDEGNSGGANQVPTVVISNTARGQGQVATSGNHYGTLRAIEEAFGLAVLGGAASSANGDLTRAFG